jgi:hypothetical protein
MVGNQVTTSNEPLPSWQPVVPEPASQGWGGSGAANAW